MIMKKSASVSDRMAVAEKRYGKTLGASKGVAPTPKAKVNVKPKGNLSKPGIKATVTQKFSSGKWAKK